MAVGDIYHVQVSIAVRDHHTSFGLYYRETGADANFESDCEPLATAVAGLFLGPLIPILGVDAEVSLFTARKIKGIRAIPGNFYPSDSAGTGATWAMPANTGLRIQQIQNEGPGRHNGAICISGIQRDAQISNSFDAEFIAGVDATITPLLSTPITGPRSSTTSRDSSEFHLASSLTNRLMP
jgi:hypothetical protein